MTFNDCIIREYNNKQLSLNPKLTCTYTYNIRFLWIIGASLSAQPHTSESFRAIVHAQKITTKIGELTRASRI